MLNIFYLLEEFLPHLLHAKANDEGNLEYNTVQWERYFNVSMGQS